MFFIYFPGKKHWISSIPENAPALESPSLAGSPGARSPEPTQQEPPVELGIAIGWLWHVIANWLANNG